MKSRLYTRTGDSGTTSLVGGTRVPKDSLRLEAYGTTDELNSWLGLLASSDTLDRDSRDVLLKVQHRLFDIGAALATEAESEWQPKAFPDSAVAELEAAIDEADSQLPPLRQFVLPGGDAWAARANIARTVCRRAERLIISLSRECSVDSNILRYINRLSDYLFALGRKININTDTPEIFWQNNC